jgi:triphosphatase
VTEFELKFQVDAERRAVVEAAVARGRSHRGRLRARYFDTPDGALAAFRIVLRLRKEGGGWVQTAKAPTDNPLERLEHNIELPPSRPSDLPEPVIARHEGTAVGALIAKALQKAGHNPARVELVPLYATDVWRTTREMRTGDALVELAFDVGQVKSDARSHPLCELELELKHGSPASMIELAGRWCARYALWLDTVSKAERGARLARGEAYGAPVKSESPQLDRRANGPELFRAVLNNCLRQILPNASEVAAGSSDAEHIHQLRVGIRRLRTALREMAELAPSPPDPAWDQALVEAFRDLGARRDLMLLQETVQPQIEAAGGPPIRLAQAAAPPIEAAAVVRAAGFQRVMMHLIAASLADGGARQAAAEAPPPASPRKILRERLAKLHQQVVRDGKRFESLEPAEQHRVRKRLKRLRYLGEFAAGLFDRRAARRYLERLEPVQDALGAHNDAAVAIAACRENAGHDGASWFAVGWLTARHPASARECAEALAEFAEAPPFWD